MSGWQTKSLQDVQARYDLPIGGPKTDLEVFFHALRQFLLKHGKAIQASKDPRALDELRSLQVKVKELELARMKGEMVPIAQVHDAFTVCGTIMRNVGTAIEKQWPEAAEVLREGWDDCEETIARLSSGEPGQ